MYHIYYLNVYKTSTQTRDQAVSWIMQSVNKGGGSMDDYEILDRSDFL